MFSSCRGLQMFVRRTKLVGTVISFNLSVLMIFTATAVSQEKNPANQVSVGSVNRSIKTIPRPNKRFGETGEIKSAPQTVTEQTAVSAAAPSPWTPLLNQMPATRDAAVTPGAALLLTDGRVFAQDAGTTDWWLLTPDAFGSYVKGTWTFAAPMPYAPLYFASAVLPDGRVLVEGGEYVDFNLTFTNQGAIYDPLTDTWASVDPPADWRSIGDAPSVVLADGTFMMGDIFFERIAKLDLNSLIWFSYDSSLTGKASAITEEGWTLLGDGRVLTVDTNNFVDPTNSEIYDPTLNRWNSAGSTVTPLINLGEIGPHVLRPDGTVFAAGATGHNSIYNSRTGRWTPGPDFPLAPDGQQLAVTDGGAALLPNGNVLIVAAPTGAFNTGAHFFEFNGRTLTEVSNRSDAGIAATFVYSMLVLPTGEILVNNLNDNSGAQIYKSSSERGDWEPEITAVPRTLRKGLTYQLSGIALNGVSQGASYGDDFQTASNYPLVRITNRATGHVFFARTHNHTSMSVDRRKFSATQFDIPNGIETGSSNLAVVTNGIASESVRVNVTF